MCRGPGDHRGPDTVGRSGFSPEGSPDADGNQTSDEMHEPVQVASRLMGQHLALLSEATFMGLG